MAASMQQTGASPSGAPFPSDAWYEINRWEVEGNGVLKSYRSGDAFSYKLEADGIRKRDFLPALSPDIYMEIFRTHIPVRSGENIQFVLPDSIVLEMPSVADPTKRVTRDRWAVTMISQALSTPLNPCKAGGHAYILIEGINEFKQAVQLTAEIYTAARINKEDIEIHDGRAAVRLDERVKFDPDWPRSDTFLRASHLVQEMIEDVKQQIAATFAEEAAGRPHIIRFDPYSPNPSENIHNCLSWAMQECEIAHVRIPRSDPSIPGSGWYIPKYHLDFLDTLCKRAIRKENPPVEEYARGEDLEDLRNTQIAIVEGEKTLTHTRFLGFQCILGSAGTIFLFPFALIGIPIALAVQTYEFSQKKKDFENKKIEVLKKSYQE